MRATLPSCGAPVAWHAAVLRERGADVQLEVQQASHGLIAADLALASEFLARTA